MITFNEFKGKFENKDKYQEEIDKVWNGYVDDVDEALIDNAEKLSEMKGYFKALERYSILPKEEIWQMQLTAMNYILKDELKRG